MLYLNNINVCVYAVIPYLTLTSVVFESYVVSLRIMAVFNLTLTSVVFEFTLDKPMDIPFFYLTLTSVVFEFVITIF